MQLTGRGSMSIDDPSKASRVGVIASVTRWIYFCSLFAHLQHSKFTQKRNKFAKVG